MVITLLGAPTHDENYRGTSIVHEDRLKLVPVSPSTTQAKQATVTHITDTVSSRGALTNTISFLTNLNRQSDGTVQLDQIAASTNSLL